MTRRSNTQPKGNCTAVNSRTLPAILARRARETPLAAAFSVKASGGAWETVTWGAFERSVDAVARALVASGISCKDRIGILGPTSIEWEYLQMGALRMGAVAVGIDPNYADETLQDLLRALDLAALGVKDVRTLARIPPDVRRALKLIVFFEAPVSTDAVFLCLPDLVSGAHASAPQIEPLAGPGDSDPAIVVFSSGTTGTPKPITYTHAQVVLAIDAIVDVFPDIEPGSHFACWLPLANLFQRIINFCAIEKGATSYMVPDPRSVIAELGAISPAILIGVPRFYERLHAGISAQLEAAPGLRGAVGRWALRLARRRAFGTAMALDRALTGLADALVFSRIRATFGPRLRYLISGSAPMARWLLDWYEALGLSLYEAYGVSENIIPVAMNRPGARRLGTVGKPLPANEVRLAEDGEILVRGPGLSADCLAAVALPGPEGGRFWPTGDLGRFDEQGFLSVTGRKSDVFKSAAGRWVVPQHIEAALRTVPYADHVVAVGAGRPGVVAIVSVNRESLSAHAGTRASDSSASPLPGLTEDERRMLQRDFAGAGARLAESERPKVVIVVDAPFTVEGGELTTNLKLRRQAIENRFQRSIAEAYSALEAAGSAAERSARARPLILLSS